MKPSVGRVVHYVSYGTPGGEYGRECRAAIVTELGPGYPGSGQVGLCVLNPAGMFFNHEVQYSEGIAHNEATPGVAGHLCGGHSYPGGTWHWPARVG